MGKGIGLKVFVYINEFVVLFWIGKGFLDWEDLKIRWRFKCFIGVVESKNIIIMKNFFELSCMIDIYYLLFCEGEFFKEEVLFYLGFSWF